MKKGSVSTKKTNTKVRAGTNSTHEVHAQRLFFSVKEADATLAIITLELALSEAPKTCDVFMMNVPSTSGNDRNRSKQGCYKDCPVRRLTSQGMQSGEVIPASKPLPLSDLEGEVGAIPHGLGTVSMCRSTTSFDASQFFVCLTTDENELEHMNRSYPVFARVVDGLDALLAVREKLGRYLQEDGKIDPGCPITFSDFVSVSQEGVL